MFLTVIGFRERGGFPGLAMFSLASARSQADEARSRLVHAVEELGQRRDDVSDLRLRMRRLGRQIALVAGALFRVTVGTMTSLVVWGARTGATPRRRKCRPLVQRMWR